jgi:hypothetical protein
MIIICRIYERKGKIEREKCSGYTTIDLALDDENIKNNRK